MHGGQWQAMAVVSGVWCCRSLRIICEKIERKKADLRHTVSDVPAEKLWTVCTTYLTLTMAAGNADVPSFLRLPCYPASLSTIKDPH